jgi:hypothetical protein
MNVPIKVVRHLHQVAQVGYDRARAQLEAAQGTGGGEDEQDVEVSEVCAAVDRPPCTQGHGTLLAACPACPRDWGIMCLCAGWLLHLTSDNTVTRAVPEEV